MKFYHLLGSILLARAATAVGATGRETSYSNPHPDIPEDIESTTQEAGFLPSGRVDEPVR